MGPSSDRRHFLFSALTGASTAPALMGFFLNSCKSTGRGREESLSSGDPIKMTVRKSATDPGNKKNIELYRKAVAAMKAENFPQKINNKTISWWEAQATIHNAFCPHGNWFFLPWHRAYLHFFERVCRRFCGDDSFALPYWDWTADARLPEPFTTGDEKSNALYNKTRSIKKRDALKITEIQQKNIDKIIGTSDFFTFGGGPSDRTRITDDSIKNEEWGYSGILETGPHNLVHATLEGDMGTFNSPRDPIFWLHHCNVDRLWAQWVAKRLSKDQSFLPSDQPKGSPQARLSQSYWLQKKVGGFYKLSKKEDGYKPFRTEYTVADLINPAQMGLAYDTVKQPEKLESRLKAIVQKSVAIKPKSKSAGLVDTRGEIEFFIPPSAELDAILSQAAESRGDEEATLRLLVHEVPFPENPKAKLHFYLNRALDGSDELNPDFIGSVNFFGHDHAGHPMAVVFDLVPTIKALVEAGRAPFGKSEDLRVIVQWVENPAANDLSSLTLDLEYVELG